MAELGGGDREMRSLGLGAIEVEMARGEVELALGNELPVAAAESVGAEAEGAVAPVFDLPASIEQRGSAEIDRDGVAGKASAAVVEGAGKYKLQRVRAQMEEHATCVVEVVGCQRELAGRNVGSRAAKQPRRTGGEAAIGVEPACREIQVALGGAQLNGWRSESGCRVVETGSACVDGGATDKGAVRRQGAGGAEAERAARGAVAGDVDLEHPVTHPSGRRRQRSGSS